MSVTTSSSSLPLMEHFYTIQGEGHHQGRAAYFVRLGGCDVGCTWCDVKESWDATAHPLTPVAEIVAHVRNCGAKICVVTGGEPLMYDLTELTKQLHEAGIQTHIETSAAFKMTGDWDWVCISPKRFKLPLAENMAQAHELKVVIVHRNDFRFAEEYAAQVNTSCQLFLQPEWSKEQEVLPTMIEYVKQHQQWMISVQAHKYMHVP